MAEPGTSAVSRPPLVAVVGPTAVGKTEIAIQLAERLNGEIVSADSRLFYRGLNIGTAKPSREELQRAPHHLIDFLDPDEPFNLAVYQQAAHQTIAEIHARGRLPFLVGGTGQYIFGVTQNWQVPSTQPQPELRQALEAWAADIGALALYQRLQRLDPEAAQGIEYKNVRRTIRALEVIFTTGIKFSAQKVKGEPHYNTFWLGLTRPRPELYERIDQRIDLMLQAGLLAEVQDLLAQGYAKDLPSLSAIGYREMIAYLEGQLSLEEAVRQMKRFTRQYVRRQANWFKESDPNIHWFLASEQEIDGMEAALHSWLPPLVPPNHN